MAASGIIWGAFSGITTDKVRPYIKWEQYDIDNVNNQSKVRAELRFKRVNTAYYGYGTSYNTRQYWGNGSAGPYDVYFQLAGSYVDVNIVTIIWLCTHNPDGSYSAVLRGSGQTDIFWGSFDFSQTITLEKTKRACAVSTSSASNVSYHSATVGGNVTTTGIPPCSNRGVYWGTSPDSMPNFASGGSGGGAFSVNLSNLQSNTTYYFRAAAYNTSYGWRYGSTLSFTTPQESAYITSGASFMAGNSIPLTFSNPANGYLKVRVYVHDGTDYEPYIKDQLMGQTTSGTVTFTQAEINKIYTQLGSASSRTSLIRVYTYSDSGYTNQIGSYQDKYGTCSKPSRATLNTDANLTIGNNKAVSFSNPNSKYVRLEYWINGNAGWYKVKDEQVGTGTSYTFTMTSTDNDNMYSRLPNVTSASAILRAYTYAHSDYTTQVADYHDTTGTVWINQDINKPTFSSFAVSNLDKTVNNADKYGNALVSSSTSTLLGSNNKMIKGFSKLRAIISVANKMIPKNYATGSKYRFISGSKYAEGAYSPDADVAIDIDNAEVEDVTVTAYDSRSLTTQVVDEASIINNAQYVPVSISSLELVRDNNVDSKTKLILSGSYWKEYFGGGTSGVLNTITAHYRYKETTASWGSQTWNSLTLTDTDGALSFNNYINGDQGADGFDIEKSFNIEVRIYDKLTNTIVERTLNVGIPLMDWTSEGLAIKAKYNSSIGGSLQIDGKKLLDWFYPVGTIYETTSSNFDTTAKMNTYFGGTWEAYGSGRVLVGRDPNYAPMDSVNETGGEKTHTLTTAEMPYHNHTFNSVAKTAAWVAPNFVANYQYTDQTPVKIYSDYAGSGAAHNNLQPYIVVFRYRRVA